jgi:hypothetical protein
MNLSRRLRRHLSFANAVACLALFVALGGSAYAASQINGSKIVKQSIGGGKLKNETITSKQIKKASLGSSVIDVSALGTVPSAQTAVTATSADTASSASTAAKATSAETANRAGSAETADRATSAESAASATSAATANRATSAATAEHATSADTASEAGHASEATEADHADEAGTLGGKTAAELTDTCLEDTEPFGGMCWDEQPRATRSWFAAANECAHEEGRLPSLSELIAYISQGGEQAPTSQWSSDVADLVSGEEEVFTASESGREKHSGGLEVFEYRCLFYRTNAG